MFNCFKNTSALARKLFTPPPPQEFSYFGCSSNYCWILLKSGEEGSQSHLFVKHYWTKQCNIYRPFEKAIIRHYKIPKDRVFTYNKIKAFPFYWVDVSTLECYTFHKNRKQPKIKREYILLKYIKIVMKHFKLKRSLRNKEAWRDAVSN
jgi:hypothetical protein